MKVRARGRCPDCGRIVCGRAYGIQRAAADRKLVLLNAHTRKPDGHGGRCLSVGWRIVPRVR